MLGNYTVVTINISFFDQISWNFFLINLSVSNKKLIFKKIQIGKKR